MTTEIPPHQCSICHKSGGNCICGGCQTFFCVKHFLEHREVLSTQFDHDVVTSHNELVEQIHQVHQSNNSSDDLFSQIDRWEKSTIEKVHNAAENVRHQLTLLINTERETLSKQFEDLTKEICRRRQEDDFIENDIKHIRQQINVIQQSFEQFKQLNKNNIIVVETDWDRLIYVEQRLQAAASSQLNILLNARWVQNGITLTDSPDQLTQLQNPCDLYIDDDQSLIIADFWNHRIVEWKYGAISGQVVAGGHGEGNQNNQLNRPTNVIVDKKTDSLIICDRGNRRVMRWPRQGGTTGQMLISNVACCNLTIDNDGFLYITDEENHEVRRWRVGETQGKLVAGGNGQGHRLDQLNSPTYIYVDGDHSVYVSDLFNHRVMKWMKDATEGFVVAGGQGQGDALTQLSHPRGLFVDQSDTVYVVDCTNHRVMRWFKGDDAGSLVVGGNGQGRQANQLYCPVGLSFDRHGNLYVVDQNNDRVQRFDIELT